MEQRQMPIQSHLQTLNQPIIVNNVDQNQFLQNNNHNKKQGAFSTQHKQLLQKFINRFILSYLNEDLEQTNLLNQFVKDKISPLSHLHAQVYSQILQEEVIDQYFSRLKQTQDSEKIVLQSLQVFIKLTKIYKDNSVNPIIINVTLTSFKQIWNKHKVQRGSFSQKVNLNILNLWKYIPYQFLTQFLQQFDLLKSYQQIKLHEFFSYLSKLFFENKIQQGCEYYRLYKQGQIITQQNQNLFQKFEYEQLLPRITKKQHIFSEFVVNLIKNDRSISNKVFECIEVKESQKLVKLAGKNIQDHPKITLYAMKKHYKDVTRKNKEWYVIEDKICYSLEFIKWLVRDLSKKYQQINSNSQSQEKQEEGNNFYFIKSEQEAHFIIQSISKRAMILPKTQNYIENPLYQLDNYIPAEFIFSKINNNPLDQTYLTLQSLNLTPQDILFLDKIDEQFYKANSHLLSAPIVGFDTQFWATTTKYEEGGTSIIQLATHKKCFIFDYQALKKQIAFQDFLINLMSNDKIIKVGHTVQSDLQLLLKSFKKELKLKGLIDLTHIIKKFYRNQVFSSLAFMSQKFLGMKMCKYEQRSNWNRRPLKKTQICYACLDALACIYIYQKMQKQKNNSFREVFNPFNQKKQFISQMGQQKSVIQKKKEDKQKNKQEQGQYEFEYVKFKDYLQKPIFLVDNMLKKLCSTMRNCGLDTEFISVKDYDLATSQSKKEKRILITRDSKLIQKKYSNFAIYLLKERGDSDIMFKEILNAFNLDLNQFETLSRCVKCNNHELIVIHREEAMKEINFSYEDSSVQVFWRCTKCKQIYWEGGQFKKAKSKYEQLRK